MFFLWFSSHRSPWKDTIRMLNSDASLDLFRKRGAALLQFSSHDKVQKARPAASVPALRSLHLDRV